MKIGWGVSELCGVENLPLPLTWPMAYTTACTTVQAVIIAESCPISELGFLACSVNDDAVAVSQWMHLQNKQNRQQINNNYVIRLEINLHLSTGKAEIFETLHHHFLGFPRSKSPRYAVQT